VLPRLDTITQQELEEDFARRGPERFREKWGCPFLVVIYTPPRENTRDDKSDENTGVSSLENLADIIEKPPSKRLIPIRGRAGKRDKPSVSLGRESSNDIVVRAAKVSRRHAEFIIDKRGRTGLRDLGSANGTKVNGKFLVANKPVRLKSGDMIGIWHFLFQYVEPEPMLALLKKPS